jgi:hypothetical protein
VLNRRQAAIGYLTYRIGRRLAQRQVGRKFDSMRSGRDADEGQDMTKTQAATERAAALIETIKPIVTRAMADPELHGAVRQAFATGKDVKDEYAGTPPKKAARKLARDHKLHKRVEASATDLQRAVAAVVEPPKKKGKFRKTVGRIAVVGAVAGAVVVVLRKFRRGGGDDVAF